VGAARAAGNALLEQLSSEGYQGAAAEKAEALRELAESLQPEAILLSTTAKRAPELLDAIRGIERLRSVPVLVDMSRARSAGALKELPADGFINAAGEVIPRLVEVLQSSRLREREERTRLRMGMLLEITQWATSSLELEEILRIAVEKVGRVTGTDRCSVVLVEGANARTATVVATKEDPSLVQLEIEVARYPELRRALETRQPVLIQEAQRDPLLEEVRTALVPLGVKSILVQPLICQDDLLGALFLRLSRDNATIGREEQEFTQAVACVLANSIRNARLHSDVKRKRDDLELAYVERYRELTDANRRLKELNRLKDEIIAVCSHDLRAPLQVLLGHGRLLLDGDLESQQKQSAEAMIRQGKKILGLVESLLEKGKGEAARLSLEARMLDVSKLGRELTGELEILAAEKGVALRADCPESLMLIGDELKLHEVLQNLITNAIHHARDAGEVVVRTQRLVRPDGDAAKIMVQDDGVGIPPDELHLVFDRYRHGPKGTGLGLAICKEFVELHGGEIWAESPPSGGCTFVFTVPLAQEAVRNARSSAVQEAAAQPRVLVVEDEPEIASVLTEVLRSRYRVEVARDGAEGLAKARASRPDLVVMDVFLPKLDGLDAAVALKSSSDTAHIPVILLSAHQGVADKVRSLNLGAVDYMSKPFQALELLSRTERALKMSQSGGKEKEQERGGSTRRNGSDAGTGLHDRRGLVQRLEAEIARARRYQRPLSLAMLRPVQPVTEVPPTLGAELRRRLRGPDSLAHMGEGVFAIILPDCNPEQGRGALGRLLPDLKKSIPVEYQSAVADVSVDTDPVERILEKMGAPVAIA
jgi:signal transduction histidine kinase/DNA-binding response OmpR family regulator